MSSEERRPCATCKRFRGKCTHDCDFFPPENTKHSAYGAAPGYISVLQQNLKGVQYQHQVAKKELHFWLSRNPPPPQQQQDLRGPVGPESSHAATQRLAMIAREDEMMRNGGGTSGPLHSGDDVFQPQQYLMQNFDPDSFRCQQRPPQRLQEQAGPTGVAAVPQRVLSDQERSGFGGGNASS